MSSAPVVRLKSTFHLNVNIIYSQIELIQGAPLGGLVAILSGKSEEMDAAIQWLLSKNVKIEVIRDGVS